MTSAFQDVTFNPVEFRVELARFEDLLKSKPILGEREIQDFFDHSLHLTAYVGVGAGLGIRIAKRVKSQFQLMGKFTCDLAFGVPEKAFCLVELEDGDPRSVLHPVGEKSTKEWGKRFEHGFSQLVDWFCLLDGQKNTPDFHGLFGYGSIDFFGLLLVGRTEGLSEDDVRRLRWRKHHVIVNSHPVFCMTYDELYEGLKESFELHAAAFAVESNPPAPSGQKGTKDGPPQNTSAPQAVEGKSSPPKSSNS